MVLSVIRVTEWYIRETVNWIGLDTDSELDEWGWDLQPLLNGCETLGETT